MKALQFLTGLTFLAVVFGVALPHACRATYPAANEAARDPLAGHETWVCRFMQQHVQDRLKAPSTSDFPSCSGAAATHVVYNGDGHYSFNSWVDAQNSFGAKIRTYFDGEAVWEIRDGKAPMCRFTRLDMRE